MELFCEIYLTVYYFHDNVSIIDVRLAYIQASENIEIFKVKVEQIITIVTTRSASCLIYNFSELNLILNLEFYCK